MTEGLKNKIDKIVNDFYTSSKSVTLYRNLKEFAYDVANEVTKELREEIKHLFETKE